MQAELSAAVSKRTASDETATQAIFDGGPYAAVEAQNLKLIDDVGFDDEALEHLRTATKTKEIERRQLSPKQDKPTLADLLSALVGGAEAERLRKARERAAELERQEAELSEQSGNPRRKPND